LTFDRDATLKRAEKLLRQGRLDLAIPEYLRVVVENPRDWSTANTLGELYARAGQTSEGIEQYRRIAEHFVEEGFYPKAAALYKKILKLSPDDEATQMQLADISARQGLLADAKSYLNAIAARRRARGDRRGIAEVVVRLGTIDPTDFEARILAARTLEEMGEPESAADRFKALHDDFREKGRIEEALDALKEFVRLNPLERDARATLAKAALETGDLNGAREFLDEHSAGEDPELLFRLAEIELGSGELHKARTFLDRLLTADPSRRVEVFDIGWSYIDKRPETSFVCIDAGVSASLAAAEYEEACAKLREFATRAPGQIPALLRLVEVCVDGGLEASMYEAQELLTDAYLAANQAAEARVIAEDLVAREPWEAAHIDRFRRALVMLRVSDPDTLIAERLSGQAPFMAHDPFFEPPPPPAEPRSEPVFEPAGATGEATAVEPLPAAVPPPAPSPMSSVPGSASSQAQSEEIDLTSALGSLDGPGESTPQRTPTLDEVFAEIREEASGEPDFSAHHMTLARTYLEIGMLDEAASALETAARSPKQRFAAAAALGRLYDRRGDQTRAIEWLERAAGAIAPDLLDVEAGRSVLYELGVLLEGAGETSRALSVFLELQSDAGDYRDVPGRIERLARVQTGG
jgi:tetratricopeptide (TPR) repeat protein